jgi:short-subunit dehydrogenase
LLWAKPVAVAAKIVQAIDKRKDGIYVPMFWWAIMVIIRKISIALFKRKSF